MLKSVIYPVNTVPDLHDLAEQLCCSVGSFPTTYLGLPLGAKYKSIDIWSSVIEKVEKRLATWQRQYLSMGGRLTLINSVMDSIPTYLMSLFSLPSKVLKQLDKVRRNFLWEGNSEGHKFHLVKWCNVVRPKLQGGLGIRDLAKHNKSMLLKWIWRYGMEGNSLWKEVVAAKHGELNHWCTKQSNSPHGVGAWKHIRKYWEDFVHQISFKVGNGLNVKFWKDRWLGNSILKELYPNLFLIARDPDSTVAQNREDNQWNLLFRRNFNDWELGSLFELMGRLEGYNMNPQATDIICWGPKAKEYTVKKGYKLLHAQNDITDLWPWKLIWKTKLPPKVICFSWLALKNACLTLDNLCRGNFQMVSRCYLCQESAESVNHLFLHCAVAADIWHMFLSLFSLNWMMPLTIREVVVSWGHWRVDRAIKNTWRMIPACIFWCLWTERNQRCFDGISTPNHSLKAKCLFSLFCWSNQSYVNSSTAFLDFVSSLTLGQT